MTQFLLHSKCIKFLDDVVHVDTATDAGEFAMTLRPHKRYWDTDGVFDELWLIEILAQAAAGLFFFQGRDEAGQAPRVGYLVSIDQFRCHGHPRELKLGDELRVRMRMTTEFFPFGVYEGSVWKGDQQIAEGEMKFLIDDGGGLHR